MKLVSDLLLRPPGCFPDSTPLGGRRHRGVAVTTTFTIECLPDRYQKLPVTDDAEFAYPLVPNRIVIMIESKDTAVSARIIEHPRR